jgi:hypothetical protein
VRRLDLTGELFASIKLRTVVQEEADTVDEEAAAEVTAVEGVMECRWATAGRHPSKVIQCQFRTCILLRMAGAILHRSQVMALHHRVSSRYVGTKTFLVNRPELPSS